VKERKLNQREWNGDFSKVKGGNMKAEGVEWSFKLK
jgi:hypothetical protein